MTKASKVAGTPKEHVAQKTALTRDAVKRENALLGFFPRATKQVRAAAKFRHIDATDPLLELENRVWILIHGLAPRFITTERNPPIAGNHKDLHLALVAIFEHWALLVRSEHTDFLEVLENLHDTKDVAKGILIKNFGIRSVVQLLCVPDLRKLNEKTRTRAKELRIGLVDERRIDYYLRLENEVGVGIWHIFWGHTFPSLISPEAVSVPALQMKTGANQRAYLFSVNAHDLLVRAFVSHRELHDDTGDENQGCVGYQRMLKKGRLGKIAKYIKKFNTFPTPIVVGFEKSAGDHFDFASKKEEKLAGVQPGMLHLPRKTASVQIIDGQHRLFGYTKVPRSPAHIVHVIAYKQPHDKPAAEMFVEINGEQRPVPQNLLWEIYPEIYDTKHPLFFRAIITESIEKLIKEEAMVGLISHISTVKRGPITFQTLCSEIERNDLLSKNGGLVESIAKGEQDLKVRYVHTWLRSLFTGLRELGAKAPHVNKHFIFSNVGIIPVLRIFSKLLHYEQVNHKSVWLTSESAIISSVRNYFKPIYSQYSVKTEAELSNMRRARVGETGFWQTVDEMTDIIQFEMDPAFPRLRPLTEIGTAARRLSHEMYRINRLGVSSGKTGGSVFDPFDYLAFPRSFQNIDFSSDGFNAVLTNLHTALIEDSGGKSSEHNPKTNRLAKLLSTENIIEIPTMKLLDDLRNYWNHSFGVLKDSKKQNVIANLKIFTGRTDLAHPNELSANDYEKIVFALLTRLHADVLVPASTQLS